MKIALLALPLAALATLDRSATEVPNQEETASAPVGPTVELYAASFQREPASPGLTLYGVEGIELKVGVHQAGATLLEIDKDATTITSWKDDQGTDLSKGAPSGFFHWAELEGRFGDDVRMDTAGITLKTKTMPSPEATRVTLDAQLGLLVASDPQQDSVTLKVEKGATMTLAGIDFEVARVDDMGGQTMLELNCQQSLEAIQAFRFHGEDGGELTADDMGSGSMGFGGKVTYSKSFGLPGKPASVRIEVDYFAKVETQTIPLKLTFGVGL